MSSLTPEQIAYYEAHANDSLQPNLYASNAIALVLAYIAVALRIAARKQSHIGVLKDDLLIIIALLPLTAYVIVGFCTTSFGEGRHIIFVTNPVGFIQGYITAITAYSLTVVLTKISILCFYYRIFPLPVLRYISYGFAAVIIAYDIALILVAALECIPLSSLWTGEPATCINTVIPFTVLGAVNVFTDFAILCLPIPFVIKLRLTRTRKFQVCGIFLLGSLVCVFGLIRVIALARAPPGDASYNQVYSGIWSVEEISVGIVAACLPTLGTLFTMKRIRSILTQARGLVSNTRGSGSGSRSTRLGAAAQDVSMPDYPNNPSRSVESQDRRPLAKKSTSSSMDNEPRPGEIRMENEIRLSFSEA